MRLAPLPTYTPPACLNAPRALSTCIPPACAACASRLCAIRLPTSALPAPCGSKRLPTCTSCACAARPFRLRRAPFPPAPCTLSTCAAPACPLAPCSPASPLPALRAPHTCTPRAFRLATASPLRFGLPARPVFWGKIVRVQTNVQTATFDLTAELTPQLRRLPAPLLNRCRGGE